MPSIDFRLYLVTDRHQTQARPLLSVLAQFFDAGGTAVQVRERDLDTRDLIELTRAVQSSGRPHRAQILLNDRVDLAMVTDADGVHLRETSLPVPAVRRIRGADYLIGVSAPSVDGVMQAEADGADFAVLGPIYDTPSKRHYGAPLGVQAVEEACGRTNFPIFAIGGISPARAREVCRAGAFGVAVISSILSASDIAQATRNMLSAIRDSTTEGDRTRAFERRTK